MSLDEIKDVVRGMNICESEDDLSFKAAVILISGLINKTCSCSKLKKLTNYWWREVVFIVNNFWANSIIYRYDWNLEGSNDEMEQFFEIILCSMAGAGEIMRKNANPIYISPKQKSYKWEEYLFITQYSYNYGSALNVLLMDYDKAKEYSNIISEKRAAIKFIIPKKEFELIN